VKKWILYILLFSFSGAYAQDTSVYANAIPQHGVVNNEKKRKLIIAGVHTAAYAGTLITLSQAWYKDYPKSSFHTFDDSKEWLQMDKIGHGWTAYNIAKYSGNMWEWAGFSHKKAVLLGGLSSFGYQTILEFLDAHSAEWGWSWADIAANTAGAGLYTTQELLWQQQRILFKFSYLPVKYPSDLQGRADELFGTSFPERLLKDYNGQTYWFSFNLNSFLKNQHFPEWLNLAVGYGASGLYGGFENRSINKDGVVMFDRRDIPRIRQWYISPDIDFTRIPTNKKGVRTLLSLMNMLKLPAPTLEYSGGKFKGHLLFF